jgi:hypothetical protein
MVWNAYSSLYQRASRGRHPEAADGCGGMAHRLDFVSITAMLVRGAQAPFPQPHIRASRLFEEAKEDNPCLPLGSVDPVQDPALALQSGALGA